MKNKKAMTMSEVLISMAVVGVLAMVVAPIIQKTVEGKEKALYKKAVNTMQNAVTSVMNSSGVVNSSNFFPEMSDSGKSFRDQVASKIITMNGVNKGTAAGATTAADPDFVSSDGMMWWGLPDTWPSNDDGSAKDYVDVHVDLNGGGGANLASEDAAEHVAESGNSRNPDRVRMRIMKDGRVIVPQYDESEDWSFETDYLYSTKKKANSVM